MTMTLIFRTDVSACTPPHLPLIRTRCGSVLKRMKSMEDSPEIGPLLRSDFVVFVRGGQCVCDGGSFRKFNNPSADTQKPLTHPLPTNFSIPLSRPVCRAIPFLTPI